MTLFIVQVPVTVSNLVSSLQQPLPAASLLPQVMCHLNIFCVIISRFGPHTNVMCHQVPVSLSGVSLPSAPAPVSSLSSSAVVAPVTSVSLPVSLELGNQPQQQGQHIAPPQTSPVNLELGGAGSGSITPTSDINEMTNSPPQSSPVNLAQSSSLHQDS